ncbi:MAG: bifunctional 2-C-methyl-D-erythritol 4-phosphate cytidylyltransferase/2-C-methyl-D-erythritol 2,4-cyclodiphosphate synthase [Hyphomicrobiales bacterium]
MKNNKVAVVIVAAGRGERAKRASEGDKGPKQYRLIGGQAIIAHTVKRFCNHPSVDKIIPVIHQDDEALYLAALADYKHDKLSLPVTGGASRQGSVYNGLSALKDDGIDYVLVHDGVRPFVSDDTIDRVIAGLQEHNSILPALAVVDTIKRVSLDAGDYPIVSETVDRSVLWSAQTPQGFHYNALLTAHNSAAVDSFTDDCAVMEAAGHAVRIVEGNGENMKITTPDDIDEAERRVNNMVSRDGREKQMTEMETRVGNGFDVHAFEDGNAVILGGISIPHTKKLKGHSDADVGLHTITDAIYGALADGDIGSHFPPSDEQWKGAASDQFLIHACDRVKQRGGRIVHLDLTLMCEAPKIGPHRDAMREQIAKICNLPLSRVAVKATTTERLGFTGREEGIAAMATATIQIPFED